MDRNRMKTIITYVLGMWLYDNQMWPWLLKAPGTMEGKIEAGG